MFQMSSDGLATPLLLAGAGSLSRASAEQTAASASAFEVKQYKFGSFNVTIISDGASVREKPWETYGTDQPQEAVKSLLQRNFLPTDRFAMSYAPAIIDTGSEVILVDTGETLRSGGAGKTLQSLTAAYTADQVTMVVLTHLHRDHIGGLTEAGAPTFKNARYAVNAAEYESIVVPIVRLLSASACKVPQAGKWEETHATQRHASWRAAP
jgi:glyoxylase-like metal-dependent hydrolase (beta-lactamase superfamily II)